MRARNLWAVTKSSCKEHCPKAVQAAKRKAAVQVLSDYLIEHFGFKPDEYTKRTKDSLCLIDHDKLAEEGGPESTDEEQGGEEGGEEDPAEKEKQKEPCVTCNKPVGESYLTCMGCSRVAHVGTCIFFPQGAGYTEEERVNNIFCEKCFYARQARAELEQQPVGRRGPRQNPTAQPRRRTRSAAQPEAEQQPVGRRKGPYCSSGSGSDSSQDTMSLRQRATRQKLRR